MLEEATGLIVASSILESMPTLVGANTLMADPGVAYSHFVADVTIGAVSCGQEREMREEDCFRQGIEDGKRRLWG